MYGINVEHEKCEEIAGELGCQVGVGAILYLGKVGGRVNGKEAWKEVVGKIKKGLRNWVSNSISLGG